MAETLPPQSLVVRGDGTSEPRSSQADTFMATKVDPVRISDQEFNDAYKFGFQTWAHLYSTVKARTQIPLHYFFHPDAFSQHPTFVEDMELTRDDKRLYVSGGSSWGCSPSQCDGDFPSFQIPAQIEVTSDRPILLSIASGRQSKTNEFRFASDKNYLTVLMLAWTYILSARWVESMPAGCTLEYQDDRTTPGIAKSRTDGVSRIDIGSTDGEEIRWWEAVLAEGQGWQAFVGPKGDGLWSPWSVVLQSGSTFTVGCAGRPIASVTSAASFADACRYLENFCVRHGVIDQSHVALAAVALFPCIGGSITLPKVRLGSKKSTTEPVDHLPRWVFHGPLLDRLMAMSCNIRSIRPMLLSVFYEPKIKCNAVTPWLQGSMAAIQILTKSNACVIGQVCAERSPLIACFWLGSTILGFQHDLLEKHATYGLLPVELPSAVWTDTIQSFIQQPISGLLPEDGQMSRSDECILLFLSRANSHIKFPASQWAPFGATPLEDLDLEVRAHIGCKDHRLQYKGFYWKCLSGKRGSLMSVRPLQPTWVASPIMNSYSVSWEACTRANEVISANETRKIFRWLRPDGHGRHEQDIWEHEWFASCSDDNEDTD